MEPELSNVLLPVHGGKTKKTNYEKHETHEEP